MTPGDPEETGAERDGHTIVGVAAEDAHQEHQEVAIAEVLRPHACVLHHKERYHALAAQFHQSLLIAHHAHVHAGVEEYDEQSCAQHAQPRLVRPGQSRCQVDQQQEQ